jgi:hypothetical protein
MSSENEVSIKILVDPCRNEIAGALAPYQQAVRHQPVERLAHRDARHREIRGEISFRGQRVVGPENTAVDGLAQRPLQLLIEGQIAATIEGADRFGE